MNKASISLRTSPDSDVHAVEVEVEAALPPPEPLISDLRGLVPVARQSRAQPRIATFAPEFLVTVLERSGNAKFER